MSKALSAFILVITCLACQRLAAAQDKVRIAWAGATPSNTPTWVADQKGFLKKNGLQAELISISASTIVVQALLTGEVDMTIGSTPTLVATRLAGHDTTVIFANVPHFVDHVVAAPSITSVEQLRGKIGGVNRLGTTSDLGLRIGLRRFGIDPEKDTQIIAIGENPQRLAALTKGIVQYTIISEPHVREAEKLGFKDLIDFGTMKIPFHWNCLVTTERVIKTRRPMVAKVVKAFSEALHYIKTDKEGAKAIIGKNLKMTDPEGLERAYRAYNAAFPEIPKPSPDGVKTLLDDMAAKNPKAASADPKSFVDQSFVQELENVGFYKQLYKK